MQAQRVRRLVVADFDAAFGHVDALLTPTTPTAAQPFDRHPTAGLHPAIAAFLGDVFTVPASLAGSGSLRARLLRERGRGTDSGFSRLLCCFMVLGLPALSVPARGVQPGDASALGLQLIGPRHQESTLFALADMLAR